MNRGRRRPIRGPQLFGAEPLEPRQVLAAVVAVGNEAGATSTPLIQLVDATSGAVIAENKNVFDEPGFRGGVRVAMGDVTGDGVPDVIAASGPGLVGQIRVFEQKQKGGKTVLEENKAYRTFPFGNAYRGGVEIAVGDVDGNGRDDLVAAMSMGAGTVSVFCSFAATMANPDPIPNQPYRTFNAFASRSIGGISVAVADVGWFANGKVVNDAIPDNKVEIVVGTGAGMKPAVVVYDVSGARPVAVKTISPTFAPISGGVSVSTGRFNDDSIEDIVVSSGRGGNSVTAVYSGAVGASAKEPLLLFAPFTSRPKPNAATFTAPIDEDGDGRINGFLATQADTGADAGFVSVSAAGRRTGTVSSVGSGVRIAAPRTVFKTQTVKDKDGYSISYFDVFTGNGATAKVNQTIKTSYLGVYGADVSGQASTDPDKLPVIYGTFVSRKAGEPFDESLGFPTPLNSSNVIDGWVEGIAGIPGSPGIPAMKTGGRRVLIIPPELAYVNGTFTGEMINGVPKTRIPANAPLIFDIGLTSVS